MPAGWETHAAPSMGDRPQEIINKQVLDNCDLLIGAFWTRIGTPTGKSVSGTVEEIEKHISAGKPAMLYFSSAPVRHESVDQSQYEKLNKFKKKCQKSGLIVTYDNLSEFKERLYRQLVITLNTDEYLLGQYKNNKTQSMQLPDAPMTKADENFLSLSDESKKLIIEASNDQNGNVVRLSVFGGVEISTNGKEFTKKGDPRSEALWESAINELSTENLLEPIGDTGEIFRVTNTGYMAAEVISKSL